VLGNAQKEEVEKHQKIKKQPLKLFSEINFEWSFKDLVCWNSVTALFTVIYNSWSVSLRWINQQRWWPGGRWSGLVGNRVTFLFPLAYSFGFVMRVFPQ